MEIDITLFVNKYSDKMEMFSNSIAESGLDNIGHLTFRAAMVAVSKEDDPMMKDWDTLALTNFFKSFGAWDKKELSEMSCCEKFALFVQFIAGDYREREKAEEKGNLEEYEQNHGGRLYQSADRWFYYAGE